MTTVTMPGARIRRNVRKSRWWMWLIVVAALAVAGYVGYQRWQAPTATTTVQTATVSKGDITATVTATGNVEPASQANLNFASGGTVKAVLVNEGDTVTAGQPLARLDTTDLQLQVTTAQATLDSARLKLQQAQQGASGTDLTTAQAKVDSAKAALAALYTGPTAPAVAQAQAQITTAEANLAKAQAGATDTEIADAQQKVEQAKNALWGAQSNRDSICGRTKNPDQDSSCQNARATVNQQEAAVQIAQNDMAALQASPDANDVTVAEQSVKQAEASLAALKVGPTAQAVAQAQATVTEAQAALDALTKGPDDLTVQVAQTVVTQAETALQQVQLKLDQATLVAPFAGVVTAVNATSGTAVGTTSNPVQIADLSSMQIDTQVSELDRAKIQVGQMVNITLDALSGKTLQGQIAKISATGTTTNGVVNYTVTVKITQSDPALQAGMTATLGIVTANKQGVLTVPTNAIQMVNGQKVVSVVRNGSTVQVAVTTGVTDGSKTEISGGVQAGDQVVRGSTGSASTSSSTSKTQGASGVNIPGVTGGGPPQ